MPPNPREGAEEALEITFVVKPENVGAVEDAPNPNPKRLKHYLNDNFTFTIITQNYNLQ